MYQLIYKSQATVPFTQERLAALLKQSQTWNEQVGITGVLLYHSDQFVQVLEGSVEAVSDLYGMLLRDVCHHHIIRLASGRIGVRRFGDWAMSFHAVEPAQLAQVRGYFAPEHLARHYEDLHPPTSCCCNSSRALCSSRTCGYEVGRKARAGYSAARAPVPLTGGRGLLRPSPATPAGIASPFGQTGWLRPRGGEAGGGRPRRQGWIA